VARDFYGRKLGLEAILDTDDFVTFRCGGDSRLVVTRSSTGTADEATQASWRVNDLPAEVAELRARGVEIQDIPDLNTVDGIADIGFAFAAWFTDPHTEIRSASSNSNRTRACCVGPECRTAQPNTRLLISSRRQGLLEPTPFLGLVGPPARRRRTTPRRRLGLVPWWPGRSPRGARHGRAAVHPSS
jgi:catechol 2,3-dioxygenase-like lactoylglutathione lyase family enzyme